MGAFASRRHSLETIPGIGPSLARDLSDLGIKAVVQLDGADPEELYHRLCRMRGRHLDPCVLYAFRCAVYYASRDEHEPELLKWWNWKNRRLS